MYRAAARLFIAIILDQVDQLRKQRRDGTGRVTTAYGSDRDTQYLAAAQDEDGRLVIAGYSGPSIFSVDHDFIVARYEADGSLDLGFAGQGYVRVNLGGHSDDFGTSVAIQTDGKIVVGGYSDALGDADFVVLRFSSDGSVDSSFGDEGRVTTDLGGVDRLLALKIQSDEKIAVAGFTYNPSSDFASVALARLNADGSLDPTFGDGGRSVPHFEPSLSERATSLDIQSDGSLVIAGYNGRFEMLLARFFADGSADTGFGLGGYQIVHIWGTDRPVPGVWNCGAARRQHRRCGLRRSTMEARFCDHPSDSGRRLGRYIRPLETGDESASGGGVSQ